MSPLTFLLSLPPLVSFASLVVATNPRHGGWWEWPASTSSSPHYLQTIIFQKMYVIIIISKNLLHLNCKKILYTVSKSKPPTLKCANAQCQKQIAYWRNYIKIILVKKQRLPLTGESEGNALHNSISLLIFWGTWVPIEMQFLNLVRLIIIYYLIYMIISCSAWVFSWIESELFWILFLFLTRKKELRICRRIYWNWLNRGRLEVDNGGRSCTQVAVSDMDWVGKFWEKTDRFFAVRSETMGRPEGTGGCFGSLSGSGIF